VPAVATRLDDAARLAARVAHDFDNVLMGVMGFVELAQIQLGGDSPTAKYLAESMQVASDALTITRQLHQFNRSGRRDPRPTGLDQLVVGGSLAGLAETAGDVPVQADIPEDLPPVAMAGDVLRMVLAHLVRNAAEAMAGAGTVLLSARAVVDPDESTETLPQPLPAGDYVRVTVVDSGPGIRADLLSRIGREPFVTTKPRRRGLGLPTVVRTLHAHGGGLRIESSPNGTAVHVYLPSADRVPPAPGRNVARAAPLEVVPS
jgi:signal transduction histidine kinase